MEVHQEMGEGLLFVRIQSTIADLKSNLTSRFSSLDVMAVFSISNPKNMADDALLQTYGENSVETLTNHYHGVEKAAQTEQDDDFVKSSTHLKKRQNDLTTQLKELAGYGTLSTVSQFVCSVKYLVKQYSVLYLCWLKLFAHENDKNKITKT